MMNKIILALACALFAGAPLTAAQAASVTYLSTVSSMPTLLGPGETGTAALDENVDGPSVLNSQGIADYYFKIQAPASDLTSYLKDLDICGDVMSSIKAVGGTALTAFPKGREVTTTFDLIPGKEYELVVQGEPKTSFIANLRVACTPAPEPAAWLLMMVGVGAIGVSVRRTKGAAPSRLAAA